MYVSTKGTHRGWQVCVLHLAHRALLPSSLSKHLPSVPCSSIALTQPQQLTLVNLLFGQHCRCRLLGGCSIDWYLKGAILLNNAVGLVINNVLLSSIFDLTGFGGAITSQATLKDFLNTGWRLWGRLISIHQELLTKQITHSHSTIAAEGGYRRKNRMCS